MLGFAIQGPAEEILFRGYIFENVRGQWGRALGGDRARAWRSALFHARNPGFGPLPFVNLVLFGVATALYKVRVDDGQLWGVFGIHTVWNWLQQVVFGLPNSGLATIARQCAVHRHPEPVTARSDLRAAASGPKARSPPRWCCWR